MASIEINSIELMALKKLALVNGALVESLSSYAAKQETKALLSVLIDVVNRADLANAKAA